jgi:hypothetical protein
VTTVDLQKLIDFGFRRASKKLLRRGGELAAFFVLVGPTGERELIEAPLESHFQKPFMACAMREWMRHNATVAYVFVHEAWWAPPPTDWQLGQSVDTPPSEHPDRMEVVVASATDGFNSRWAIWKIRRGPRGLPVTLEPVQLDPKMTLGGPWGNLLGARA